MKTKEEKQFEEERRIARSIAEIKLQREEIDSFSEDCFEAACEASRIGQDEYASELLETIVELEDFSENLRFLELKLKTATVSSKTFSRMGTLPETLKACSGVFNNGVNFKKLGKDFSLLMESLGTARGQFRDFRQSLGSKKDPVYAEIFGRGATMAEDPKYKQRIEEKKKALEARLIKTSVSCAVRPCEVSAEDEAKIDSLAAMLDDERRKK